MEVDSSAPAMRTANRRRIVTNGFMDGLVSQMLFRRQPPIPTAAETPLSDRLLLTTDTYRGVEKLHEHYLAVTKARRAAGKKVY
ncbi:hypothetical protein FNF27_00139 [Cafeteria roenbergensis]|uniref:Uncharacterized protein n=1 Tax=Cafeteria roenbergensis TaxID=33653 RepID=A0A5A8EK42_CAFRO|nr:hypothetical protein FNF29_01268 [Cafeteria roenbergensis]KAA0164231.1 hypothetical protein FNF31_02467 [Cafeteria roenbergensis]KAA0164999.1 hypothetical protein FNF28_03622 [Cafeteria roenbergensis]KAA0178286.1 hypothetical protein FNF27_00139 [Cafeteria roenbergensis]|eukprot:KAA0155848.1 hypothetical protein FNF29_01268 [Cafeteria roenbergensis]